MFSRVRTRALVVLGCTAVAATLTGISTASGPELADVVARPTTPPSAALADDLLDRRADVPTSRSTASDAPTPAASASASPTATATPVPAATATPAPAATATTPEPTTAPAVESPAPRAPATAERGARSAADDSWAGTASWYGPGFHGRTTANGETYDQHAMTAAHKTLPFGTVVEVTNVDNGRTVQVRINDRGPYTGDREIDLSRAAADALGFSGLATVELEVV